MLQNRRARTVAEKHAGVAVLPVHDGRKFFRADDEHRFVSARHDELLADLQRVDETGTRGFDVECRRPRRADFALHETRGGGKRHVGRKRRDDDQINLAGGDAGHFHRAGGGLGGEVGSEFIRGGDAAFLDAGARNDPFVRGLDHFFEFGVGQDFFRHIRTDAGDGAGAALEIMFGARIFHEFAGTETSAAARVLFAAAMALAMVWLIWFWMDAAVTRMALATARSRAEPWPAPSASPPRPSKTRSTRPLPVPSPPRTKPSPPPMSPFLRIHEK